MRKLFNDLNEPNVDALAVRFASKYKVSPNGCWIWTPPVDHRGYGRFWLPAAQKKMVAHRVSYLFAHGTIPEGLELDHLCRNRACVNPDHLEPVTRLENVRRSPLIGTTGRRKPYCKHGHAFTPENIWYGHNGARHCKQCSQRRGYEWYRRHHMQPTTAA